MFVREDVITELNVSADELLSLMVSLNRPMVSLEDRPTDEGEATICSVRRESEMVSTFVYLCLRGSATGVLYRYEADPYPEDLRDMVEGEALSFTESLGFIMDNTNFADLPDGERKGYLDRKPFEAGGTAEEGEGTPGPARSPAEFETVDSLTAHSLEAPREAFDHAGESGDGALSDEEVDSAVHALMGEGGAGTNLAVAEAVGAEISRDFNRAIEEFIGDDVPQAEEEPAYRAPLSRFQHRPSGADIYAIRGLTAEAAEQASESEDLPQEAAPPPDLDAPLFPAEGDDADSEKRARRARARYLASF